MQKLFRILINLGYKILGPGRSSMIAHGTLGRFLLKTIYRNPNKRRLFYSDEKIRLSLTPKEASLLGLIYFGTINKNDTDLLSKRLKPGDVFFDIGAYIDGWHSLVAAKIVGNKGRVYSFEPHPTFYKRLLENIKLNKLKNIEAEMLAISNNNGWKTFYSQYNISSFYQNHVTKNAGLKTAETKSLRVRTTSLDSYVIRKKIKKISLIKIDVECAEMEVLQGAKKILAKHSPNLLVEVIDSYLRTAGHTEKELIDYLKGFGYRPFVFESGHLRSFTKNRFNLNLFFTKNSS